MDPQPTDPVSESGPSGDTDRDARIEQLLLAGLDHYFAGQYERAIGVWTRVVFLERRHDRARAYIERARTAIAERQRQSDELLGSGIAAYNAGEVDAARDLLTQAANQGSDTAHVFLDRLYRVGVAHTLPLETAIRDTPRSVHVPRRPAGRPRRPGWTAIAALAVFVAAAMLLGGLPIGTWISGLLSDDAPVSAQAPPADPLPTVRGADMAIDRARALHGDGRLHDALRVLERVGIADPLRGEADRLRARIQQELLAAAGLAPAAPGLPQRLGDVTLEVRGRP
jgi:hypothetical protein